MRDEDFLLFGPRELSHDCRIAGRGRQQRQRISKQLGHRVCVGVLANKHTECTWMAEFAAR